MKAYINKLLQFDRGELNDGTPIKGYVLDYNDDWTLLQVVEQDVFFNGYSIIRNSMVEKYREFDDYDFMVQRAMKKLGYVPKKPAGINLTSLETVVLSVNAVFPPGCHSS